MTQALISGTSRLAVCVDGAGVWLLHPNSPAAEPITPGLLPHLFEGTGRIAFQSAESLDAAQSLLDKACIADRAFHMALLSMDEDSDGATRDLAEDALEEFLEQSDVRELVENRLFACGLPPGAGWLEDRETSPSRVRVAALKAMVVNSQEPIRQVRQAWDSLPEALFEAPSERAAFEDRLIERGGFRLLAGSAARGAAQLQLLSDGRYHSFPNFRRVLLAWSKAIPMDRDAPHSERAEPEKKDRDRDRSHRPDKASKLVGHHALKNVEQQKAAILDRLGRADFNCVEKFVDELVESQCARGETELAAKSLCDLAARAKELGHLDYQLAWSRHAAELSPEDPYVHAQLADALLMQNRLSEALGIYQATVGDFPQNAVARNGLAEVLKATGRLPEALEAYQATVQEFPQDVVARTGLAEVLKATGRLPEALVAYQATVQEFPQNVVARTGLAEVLKAIGRLSEAIEAYQATVQEFPQNVVARTGLAEVLKATGRLPEALEAYQATVQEFPQDVVARTGLAEVLKAIGRFPEALEAYQATVREFPQSAVARTGLAEVLKATGRLPEALEAYQATVQEFPQSVVARNGLAEVLKAIGRFPEALEAYQATVREFPQSAVARTGLAEVLKATGRLPEALEAYQATVQEFPQSVVARNGLAEVLKATGRLPDALEAYRATVRDFPQDAVARTGLAEVLKATGRLPEALEAYQATVRDFPQNVVARNGLAQVLKAVGRLPEALEAYQATVQDFPQDVVARCGLAGVFLALGQFDEAFGLLSARPPQTRDEWISFHMRAAVEMKRGRFKEADALFARGAQCPWADVRTGFIATRALLRVRTKRLEAAAELIRSEQSPVAKVIRIDIYRRMGRKSEARPLLRELRDCKVAKVIEITRDLEESMRPGGRRFSDDEFFEREFELVLAA